MREHAGIQFKSETLVSLREAARTLPARRNGKPLHISTLCRWAARGVRGVVLETLRIGGTRYTSLEALQRFFERQSTGEACAPAEPSRGSTAADRELERRGF